MISVSGGKNGISCLIGIHIAFWIVGVFLAFAEFPFLFGLLFMCERCTNFNIYISLSISILGHCDLVTGHNDFRFWFLFCLFSLSLRHDNSL